MSFLVLHLIQNFEEGPRFSIFRYQADFEECKKWQKVTKMTKSDKNDKNCE